MNYKKYKLGELIKVKHGYPFKSEFFLPDGPYMVMTPGNFKESGGLKITPGKERFYGASFPDEYMLHKGDLVVAMTEQTPGLLGSSVIIPSDCYFLHNQRIGLVTIDESIISKDYLYYLFNTGYVRTQIERTASGTKIRHTSPERLYDVVVSIPESVQEQQKIADVLLSMDRRIELCSQTRSELESMAKDIYNYWFVQFDFPNENGKPYKSSGGKMVWNEKLKREIPEGWKVGSLKGLYSIDRGLSYSSKDIESGNGVPMINLACIDRKRQYRDGELKYHAGVVPKSSMLNPGDLLIACTDLTREREIIGCPILVPDDGVRYTYSMDIARITFPGSGLNDMYMYMALRTDFYHNYIKAWASGTNVLHLNLEGLDWYTMIFPPKELQERFAGIIRAVHKKTSLSLSENRELTSLRDWLLPMLMNGQVKVGKKNFEYEQTAPYMMAASKDETYLNKTGE